MSDHVDQRNRACTSWLRELDEGHAAELGEIGRLYQERLREVLAMLVG
jgi:hypothetical protein